MTRRDVNSRYRGSMIGLVWSFVNPLLMLVVYTFVFSVVFKARWNINVDESKSDFSIILFAGMIVFNLFAEIVNRAPVLVISNVNYVKKVVFPLEILSWVSLGSALFNTFVSLLVLLSVQFILNQSLPWTVVLFPIVLLPLIFACLGFAWLLSALGVFVRDIGQVTGVVTTIFMFFSAVFYPLSALPEDYQNLLRFNPLIIIITESRNVLIYGSLPNWFHLSIALFFGFAIAAVGFWWFQKTRKGFADVI